MMTLLNRWFIQATGSHDYRSSDYVWLWLILGVGVILRFWGLDNVGFHGDEETMAMPAMAIIETGHPYLPSGMYYSRALLNIYLMSGSVWLFGESEWAFRLPSAIVGSFTGLVAFFMGRRFLSPQTNLAFVASVTLLPGMIEVSQTARMYVFLVTCLIWFGACLFRWERDQRTSSLIAALLVWVLSLHFHTLAIFAAPLFLFPGISRHSWNQLLQGGAAFLAGGLLFTLYSNWISSKYPQDEERPPPLEEGSTQTALDVLMSGSQWLLISGMLVAAALGAVIVARAIKRNQVSHIAPVLLVICAVVSMVLLHYHLGGILMMFGVMFWLRTPDLPRSWLVACLVALAVIGIIQVGLLYDTGLYPGRKLIGAMVGVPSVWPTLRFLEYSPFAGLLYVAVLGFAFYRFANGRPIPMHVLFFTMAVWVPLLIVGYFTWWAPPRYAMGQLGYFLMCTFAGVVYVAQKRKWIAEDARLSRRNVALLVLVTIGLINPIQFGKTVNPDYTNHPDHKGAAEYIKSLQLEPDTILIAEDILQQTYYLKKVPYYLREIDRAHGYAVVKDGRLVDQYTGAAVLGTGSELEEILDASGDRDVFIIGSGENFVAGKRNFRGRGISDVLESDRLEIVYTGRDSKTRVWKLVR